MPDEAKEIRILSIDDGGINDDERELSVLRIIKREKSFENIKPSLLYRRANNSRQR